MNPTAVADILGLPVQERIHLVELIWDSIATAPQDFKISSALTEDLRARLQEFERDPDAGYSWDEVKTHLKNATWPSA